MDNEALYLLVGQLVEVRTNSADKNYTDQGTLEAFDYPWLRIRRSENEVLCFPLHNIRLVKVLEWRVPKHPAPEDSLLRPVGTAGSGRPVLHQDE